MDAHPEGEHLGQFSANIMSWQRGDYKTSQTWINSLPPGRKKELLLEWLNTVDSRRIWRKKMTSSLNLPMD